MPVPMEAPTAAAFLFVIGIVLYMIALVVYALPVGECDVCKHCRDLRLARSGKTPGPG